MSLKFAQDNRERYLPSASYAYNLTIFSFWGVFWVDCSTKQTIEQGFSDIARRCGIENGLQAIRTWLSNTPEQWLLIFDNADDPSIDISYYFPAGSRGIILITTRNPDCIAHQTVGSYEFAGMDVEEAVDLLLKTIGTDDLSLDESRITATNIVTTLGGLTLAVIQAGAAIRQNLCPIEDYCDMYDQRRRELLRRAPTQASSDYKYTVYTTWEVSIGMIEEMKSEVASHSLDLIRLFSLFHFDGIPEEIFRRAWENTAHKASSDRTASNQVRWLYEESCSEWNPYLLREAIMLLSSFSLIKVDSSVQSISMHPLVHAWAFDRLSTAERRRWLLLATVILGGSVSSGKTTSDYKFRRSLVSHVTICLKLLTPEFSAISKGEQEFLEIVTRCIRVCDENGQWQMAMELGEKVLESRRRILGSEHPLTLVSMSKLATSYSDLGQLQDAADLMEKVLEARRRTLGVEHPHTLASMSNLATSYRDLGRTQDAVDLGEKVLEDMKRTLGAEHHYSLVSMSNLASTYRDLGRQQDAIEVGEKVLEAMMRTIGIDHPHTLASMGNLAKSYRDLGRTQDAVELGEKVLEAMKRTLRPEHPDTLALMRSLATCYRDLGRLQDAVELREKVLEAMRAFRPDHPYTVVSMGNLSQSYRDIGRTQDAIELGEKVIEAWERTIPLEHPVILISKASLVQSYYNDGFHRSSQCRTESHREHKPG